MKLEKNIKLALKKDKISLVLFFLTYVIIVFLSYANYHSYDDDISSYLIFHKLLFSIFAIMSLWCHIKCATTDPGRISHETNPHIIEFYSNIREEGINRAVKINASQYGRYY